MPSHSDKRREAVVAKLSRPRNLSVREVAQQERISEPTVYKWRKEAGSEKILWEQCRRWMSRIEPVSLTRWSIPARATPGWSPSWIDWPARSVRHMFEIIETLAEKGAALRILEFGIDTGKPTGKFVFTVLGTHRRG